MEFHSIGQSDLRVARLAFGGNVFGWTVDQTTSFELLDAFVDAGFNLIDTADVYATWLPAGTGGESETIIGRWMKARRNRDKVIIATKVGHELSPEKKGLAKEYVMQAVEDSLRRLQTDYIDLYQAHKDDPVAPQEESLAAFDQLVKRGKVRVIGASNFKAERLASALAISEEKHYPRYQCLQPCYNLYDRVDFEGELEALCLEKQIGVIPYFSLGAGFLTGKYRSESDLSQSPRGTRVKKYLNERGFRILAALDEVAAETSASPSQVAIAWLLTRPSVTAPIASATTMAQLKSLIGATRLRLTPDQVNRLTQAGA